MERYTLQERIEINKIHYKNGENLAETLRKTPTFLGRRGYRRHRAATLRFGYRKFH